MLTTRSALRRTTVAASRTSPRPAPAGPSGPAGTVPRRTRPGVTPPRAAPLSELARGFALLYLEVESGRRPAQQVNRLMDPRLAVQLEGLWVRHGEPGRLVAITGQRTSADSYEAVAVVRRGRRHGALALRMTRRDGRWVVTDASRPEDGRLPDPPFAFPSEGVDAFDLVGEATAGRDETGQRRPLTIAL